MTEQDANQQDDAPEQEEGLEQQDAGGADGKQEKTPDEIIAEQKDQLLRALAEAENTRRRAERDKQDAAKYGVANFARDVLTVADNLHRALEALENVEGLPDNVKGLITGIEMTDKQLMETLERHGVKKVKPEAGDKFDPNLHQAMVEVDTTDVPTGTIAQLFQPGYVIHERLLRPAMVGVAKSSGGAAQKASVDRQV